MLHSVARWGSAVVIRQSIWGAPLGGDPGLCCSGSLTAAGRFLIRPTSTLRGCFAQLRFLTGACSEPIRRWPRRSVARPGRDAPVDEQLAADMDGGWKQLMEEYLEEFFRFAKRMCVYNCRR